MRDQYKFAPSWCEEAKDRFNPLCTCSLHFMVQTTVKREKKYARPEKNRTFVTEAEKASTPFRIPREQTKTIYSMKEATTAQMANCDALDLWKMIAALFVVSIHSQPFVEMPVADFFVSGFLCPLAVPFFFVTSSFLFYRRAPEKQDLRYFLRRILHLYAFWFVIELPITFLHAFIEPDGTLVQKTLNFIKSALLHSTFRGSWYLTALMEGMVLIHLLGRRWRTKWLILLGAAAYALSVVSVVYVEFLPAQMAIPVKDFVQTFGSPLMSVGVAILPLSLGRWFAENGKLLARCAAGRKQLAALFVSALLCMIAETIWCRSQQGIEGGNLESCMLLPLALIPFFLMVVSSQLSLRINYKRLRAYSTLFFFSHFIFVFILVVINKHVVHIDPMLKFAIVLACCYIFSTALLWLRQKKGFHWLSNAY